MPVANLVVGMHIVEGNGRVGELVAWKVVPGSSVMYNLEVAQDHTFTVGDGEWVVHNCGGESKGFLDDARKAKHFSKHANEFDPPFTDPDSYEKAGKDFMSGDAPGDVHQASFYRPGSRFHGDLVRYNETNNFFGIQSSEGVLRSFYRPVNGILEFYNTFIP